MQFDTTMLDQPYPTVYLEVMRLEDGRYCVQFIKGGLPPRISYTNQADAVAQQAKRAGNIAVRTSDADVQQSCSKQQIKLIVVPTEQHTK